MIELLPDRPEAYLDVPQALAMGQLSERHGHEVVPCREASHPMIPTVPRRDAAETVGRELVEKLSKHGPVLRHGATPQ